MNDITITQEQADEIVENQLHSFHILDLSQNPAYFFTYRYLFDYFFKKFIPDELVGEITHENLFANFTIMYERFEQLKGEKVFEISPRKFFDYYNYIIPIENTDLYLRIIDEDVPLNTSKEEKTNHVETKYTYLMIDKSNNAVKIGKSINPFNREKTLQSEKLSINLLYILNKDIETELHRKYKNKRIRGEWFKLSKNELANIVIDYKFKSAKEIKELNRN